jgi:hypothetical protein
MSDLQELLDHRYVQSHALQFRHHQPKNVQEAVHRLRCAPHFRIGISLLHEDPSAHAPWTNTIFVELGLVDIFCVP